jgi:hypothetical protein
MEQLVRFQVFFKEISMARDMADAPSASPEPPKPETHKIGEGHLMGMLRLGGHELTQALAAFPDSNIRPMEEMGVLGNATPQIVTREMGMNFTDMLDRAAANRGSQDRDQEQGMSR